MIGVLALYADISAHAWCSVYRAASGRPYSSPTYFASVHFARAFLSIKSCFYHSMSWHKIL